MLNDEPTTEAIDKLFLELSQFTGAKTGNEIRLQYEVLRLRKLLSSVQWGPVWSIRQSPLDQCPFCGRQRKHGHRSDCYYIDPDRALKAE